MFENKPKQDVNDIALEYLEQRYDEKFEYLAPAGASYTGTRSFLATCESLGEKRILIEIENYKDENNRVIRDNYIAVKYTDRTKEFVGGIVNEKFGKSKVFYYPSNVTQSEDLPANASFEDFIKEEKGLYYISVAVRRSDYTDKSQLSAVLEKINEEIRANEISFDLIVVDDSEYDSCTIKTVSEMLGKDTYFAKGTLLRGNNKTDISFSGEV